MGILVVPYFPPTSTDWNVIYQQASAHPGAIKYIIINPCGGPCSGSNALSPDWQHVISALKSSDRGIQTFGYIYYTAESQSAIDYYMVNPAVKTDGILFDGEGSTDHLASFTPYATYVHSLKVNHHPGVVYINPGCNCYSGEYLNGGAANLANIYENFLITPFNIPVPAGISPQRLSAVLNLVVTCSDMVSAMKAISNVKVGNAYVTYNPDYTTLPSYFPNEVYYAATGVSNC